MAKQHQVGIRLDDDVKAALDQSAKDDHRPVAQLVQKLVIEWLNDKGYLPWSAMTAPASHADKGYRKVS